MGHVIRFPSDAASRPEFQRVQAVYTVRDISRQFGLSEHYIRRWTRGGLIPSAPNCPDGELRYDFHSLTHFRRVRELRARGLSVKQIESELRGQLNLFSNRAGRLIQLPLNLTSFEQALLLHERGDARAAELYLRAIAEQQSVPDAYCNLGILEFEAGRQAGAFNAFTLSLREDPRHFESHFNLANLYFESGDFRLAKLHYEIAGEIEPGCSNLFFNLGLVHAMSGDLEAAITVLKRSRELATEEEIAKVDELLNGLLNAMSCHS
jgi:DNA-binding transcriptional MerR regulator